MELPSTSFIPASQGSVQASEAGAAPFAKSATAYRTISEAAEQLGVPQHVLRFWETKFSQIRPMKRSGGRRYYRPQDIATLALIQNLLYGQGYTIKGVQRLLKQRRETGELANMDRSALDSAAGQAEQPLFDLDELVNEVGATAAALEQEQQPKQPQGLLAAMADVLADMPESALASAIPAHLPPRPAALMAAGLEAGRPYPPAVQLLNASTDTVVADALPIERRLRLESLLEELLSLRADFI